MVRRAKARRLHPAHGMPRALDPLRTPDYDILAAGEVQQRLLRWEGDAGGLGHGVFLELRFGDLQLPRFVVDFAAGDAAVGVGGVEAIALG